MEPLGAPADTCRRLDDIGQPFDLEVLRDLIETLSDDVIADMPRHPEHFYRPCRARLAMLPAEDLPMWRAFQKNRRPATTRRASVAVTLGRSP
jgi:hypothetical protein